jgi:ActR/RegA family two-component response regulator
VTDEPRSVLLVEDDEPFRRVLMRALQARGFEVRGAGSGEEGLALAREESPEYAVVDLKMEGMTGLEVVRELRAIDGGTRVVVQPFQHDGGVAPCSQGAPCSTRSLSASSVSVLSRS